MNRRLSSKVPPSSSFSNVGAYAVGGPDHLLTNCVLSQIIPSPDHILNLVSQIFRKFVNAQLLKVRPLHLKYPQAEGVVKVSCTKF